MNSQLAFVTCANNPSILSRYLFSSPCLMDHRYRQEIYCSAGSAAAAFNRELLRQTQAKWLVWVHQDVFLPPGWDQCFLEAIEKAEDKFPRLAVVGVYGVAGAGQQAVRAGRILDRGLLLQGTASLPCRVDSIDELLFAVRTDSGLALDPRLGFDFYATDLALCAAEQGFSVAVVDAYCEHWSDTVDGRPSPSLLERVAESGAFFEQKWAHRLPLATPCFLLERPGDIAKRCKALSGS